MTNKDHRKDLIFKLFIFYNESTNIIKMKEYHKRILEKNISEETLAILVDIAIDNNKYNVVPLFSNLIAPLKEDLDNKKKKLMDEKWEYFIYYASSPYEVLPEWAKKIKNKIGKNYIENHVSSDIPWIRKEFDIQFDLSESEDLMIEQQNEEWKKIGNSYFLESNKRIGISNEQ